MNFIYSCSQDRKKKPQVVLVVSYRHFQPKLRKSAHCLLQDFRSENALNVCGCSRRSRVRLKVLPVVKFYCQLQLDVEATAIAYRFQLSKRVRRSCPTGLHRGIGVQSCWWSVDLEDRCMIGVFSSLSCPGGANKFTTCSLAPAISAEKRGGSAGNCWYVMSAEEGILQRCPVCSGLRY